MITLLLLRARWDYILFKLLRDFFVATAAHAPSHPRLGCASVSAVLP